MLEIYNLKLIKVLSFNFKRTKLHNKMQDIKSNKKHKQIFGTQNTTQMNHFKCTFIKRFMQKYKQLKFVTMKRNKWNQLTQKNLKKAQKATEIDLDNITKPITFSSDLKLLPSYYIPNKLIIVVFSQTAFNSTFINIWKSSRNWWSLAFH